LIASEGEGVLARLAHLNDLHIARVSSVWQRSEDLCVEEFVFSVANAHLEDRASDHLGGKVDGLEHGTLAIGFGGNCFLEAHE